LLLRGELGDQRARRAVGLGDHAQRLGIEFWPLIRRG
jgi:hypothetical protein